MNKLFMHVVARHSTGSYGVLLDDNGLPFAVCLQPLEKCFKPGEYLCKKDFYHKGGYATFEIEVEGHDRVLFHKGNHQTDSKLCVLIAEAFEVVENIPGIAQSEHAFQEFIQKYGLLDEFTFVVTEKEGLKNAGTIDASSTIRSASN